MLVRKASIYGWQFLEVLYAKKEKMTGLGVRQLSVECLLTVFECLLDLLLHFIGIDGA